MKFVALVIRQNEKDVGAFAGEGFGARGEGEDCRAEGDEKKKT
jgi:hypothetical protein